MSTFALRRIEAVSGRQVFYMLLVDGAAQMDEFEATLTRAEKRSMAKIYFYMNEVANNRTLPVTKFRDITPHKANVKEYEFKDGDLRVYAIASYGGKIIVMGGYKNRQAKDIVAFRSMKNRYMKQMQQKHGKNRTAK